MISFFQAFDRLIRNTPRMAIERCRIEEAAGRVLRREIRSDRDVPAFDRVMMDGFAMRTEDFAISNCFRICGVAPAGAAAVELSRTPNACVEVMTGAPLPSGADCVVPIEEVARSADDVVVGDAFRVMPGLFIHRAGSDARAGDVLLTAGIVIGSREMGVAASCGAGWLEVSRRPSIAVLATGDELVAVDEVPAAHQIRQSNAHAIGCALRLAGYPAARVAAIGDSPEECERVKDFLVGHDWLIITGAVSKGARDFVPGLLDSLGCVKLFHGVAQRPGKPAGCWLGPDGQVVMALPGNPVSALTGLHAFVLPALAVGACLPKPRPKLVVPAERIAGLSEMTHHLPVVLGDDGRARPAPVGNSGDFIGLLRSDGFLTLPPAGGLSAAFPFTRWI